MVKVFEDLVFERQIHGGLGSSTKVGDHTLSVQWGRVNKLTTLYA